MARQSDVDPHFARAIRALREERGLTQETLAREARITVGSYARIERAESNPSWTTVTRISDALDVTLEELGRTVDKLRSR